MLRYLHFYFQRSLCYVLVFPGVELICFTLATVGVCFGSVLKNGVLITQGCLHYLQIRITREEAISATMMPALKTRATGTITVVDRL